MKTNQNIVLFNIVRKRKEIGVDDIVSSGTGLTRKQIEMAILSLKRRKLVKRNNKGEKKALYTINIKNLYRIKNILGEYWEDKWEGDWKDVIKN